MLDLTRQERNAIIVLVFLGLLSSAALAYKNHITKTTLAVTDFQAPKSTLADVEDKIRQSKIVRINSATSQELEMLDGIGPELAQRIVEYRHSNGPFKSAEEIKNVKGIGDKKFDAIKEFLKID